MFMTSVGKLVVDCKFKIFLEVFQTTLGSQLSEESKQSNLS